MSITYSDILDARRQAQESISNADAAACGAAKLISGRLRVANVDRWTLAELKKELQNFNAVTGEWKESK